jgi:4-hydroxy-3-methylbut-2-enyl diphosphate reductase
LGLGSRKVRQVALVKMIPRARSANSKKALLPGERYLVIALHRKVNRNAKFSQFGQFPYINGKVKTDSPFAVRISEVAPRIPRRNSRNLVQGGGVMQVIRAEVMGMCFGVRDALQALADVKQPEQVTIHGELVHNETVLVQLQSRGFRMIDERKRQELPATDRVMITAHGVSQRERKRLAAAGKELLDTTCPLVERAHQAAQRLRQLGCHVLVIGKPGHVEVQGIVEDLESYDIIQNPADVRTYPFPRLGLMCQTTCPERLVQEIRQAVTAKNPHADINFADTVCHPTKEHQNALEKLLDEVSLVIVVGGRNSNNTRQLVERCCERGVHAYHIQSAADLQPEWFVGVDCVGLTAGTSTLQVTIDEVHQALLRW